MILESEPDRRAGTDLKSVGSCKRDWRSGLPAFRHNINT